jgi:N-acylneuraminate cytidylyltransferase
MLAYTIAAARASGMFEAIVVSTDSEEIACVARHYGAEVPFLRPAAFAWDSSPDIEWLTHCLETLALSGRPYDLFSLLRPTSPFRTAETIRRAVALFLSQKGVDSLRAVERCSQHPGKMWVVHGVRMVPLLPFGYSAPAEQPWHSTPYQGLPPVYVQNASLEIAWTSVVRDRGTIAGDVIVPFMTEGHEGFDINNPVDWLLAEHFLSDESVALQPITETPFGG